MTENNETMYYNFTPDGRFSGHVISAKEYQQINAEIQVYFTTVPYQAPKNGGYMVFDKDKQAWVEQPKPIDPTKSTIMSNTANITKQSMTLDQTEKIIMQQSQAMNALQRTIQTNTTTVSNLQKVVMEQANQIESLAKQMTVNDPAVTGQPSASAKPSTTTSTTASATVNTTNKEGK